MLNKLTVFDCGILYVYISQLTVLKKLKAISIFFPDYFVAGIKTHFDFNNRCFYSTCFLPHLSSKVDGSYASKFLGEY